jgi:hypothetical protein
MSAPSTTRSPTGPRDAGFAGDVGSRRLNAALFVRSGDSGAATQDRDERQEQETSRSRVGLHDFGPGCHRIGSRLSILRAMRSEQQAELRPAFSRRKTAFQVNFAPLSVAWGQERCLAAGLKV